MTSVVKTVSVVCCDFFACVVTFFVCVVTFSVCVVSFFCMRCEFFLHAL